MVIKKQKDAVIGVEVGMREAQAFLADRSASSFPVTPSWPGHQMRLSIRVGKSVKSKVIRLKIFT